MLVMVVLSLRCEMQSSIVKIGLRRPYEARGLSSSSASTFVTNLGAFATIQLCHDTQSCRSHSISYTRTSVRVFRPAHSGLGA